jgi:hypothetical protein
MDEALLPARLRLDLGVGVGLPFVGNAAERDRVLGSIGLFWDANETWLVLGGRHPAGGLSGDARCGADGRLSAGLAHALRTGLPRRGLRDAPQGRQPWEPAAPVWGWIPGCCAMGFAPGWGETVCAAVLALGAGSACVLMCAS